MDNEAGNESNSLTIKTQRGREKSFRWLHVALLAIGLVGWMIFVVACVSGPAWSPDGSKILFGYYDQENSQAVIALYDRSTHKTRDVFAHLIQKDSKDDDFILVPAWQGDGTRALLAMATNAGGSSDSPHCALISIPLKPGQLLEAYNLGQMGACWDATMLPQFGNRVYLGSDRGLVWLNLATGQADEQKIEGGVGFISEHNGHLVYSREMKRPKPNAEQKDDTEGGLEFGSIDWKNEDELSLKPSFTLWGAQIDGSGLQDSYGASWEPGGKRIAMVGNWDESDGIVLFEEEKGFVSRFIPDLGVKDYHLGSVVWSHDGKTLYAPATTKADTNKTSVYSLAEIPVAGTRGTLTKIVEFDADAVHNESETLSMGLRISLSPDGKTIAATTATLKDAVAEKDRALFLIDVAHPEHHITRILPPKHEKAH